MAKKRKRDDYKKGNKAKRDKTTDEGVVKFTNDDIGWIVSAFNWSHGIRINLPGHNVFCLEYIRSNERFKRWEEKIYRLHVNKPTNRFFAELLTDLQNVLRYLINVAKSLSLSPEDFTRLYFSNAPITKWSTDVIRLRNLPLATLTF